MNRDSTAGLGFSWLHGQETYMYPFTREIAMPTCTCTFPKCADALALYIFSHIPRILGVRPQSSHAVTS